MGIADRSKANQGKDAERIIATALKLEKAWLKARDRHKARKLIRSMLSLDWEPILTPESLEGPRFQAIRAELAGKPRKALGLYKTAAKNMVLLHAEVEDKEFPKDLRRKLLRGAKKKHLLRLKRKIALLQKKSLRV